jgi:CheY-like chemotaxis protein
METGHKIMLIDDEPINNLIATKILKLFSLSTVEAFIRPQEALDELRQRADEDPARLPDTILLDINMPIMNGWQFLEEFQKLPGHVLAKTSVFILSSSNLPEDIQRAERYEAVRYFFSKPITEETVKMIGELQASNRN